MNRPHLIFAVADASAVAETPSVDEPAATPVDGASHPQPGFYYVIGSFRGPVRARALMDSYSGLMPKVLQGNIGQDGRQVYRVVVGPLAERERKVAYRRIRRAGIADTWAIRVAPKDWSLAAQVTPEQQADASGALSAHDWPGLAAFLNR